MMTLIRTIVLFTLVFLAASAGAHEFSAPATVVADGSGHFYYEVTVVITTPIEFAYVYVNGNDNTDIGEWFGDGFCLNVVEPGIYIDSVEGNLLDLSLDGSVYYEHAMCDGWIGSGTTVILAPTVGTDAVSWSVVKGRYR